MFFGKFFLISIHIYQLILAVTVLRINFDNSKNSWHVEGVSGYSSRWSGLTWSGTCPASAAAESGPGEKMETCQLWSSIRPGLTGQGSGKGAAKSSADTHSLHFHQQAALQFKFLSPGCFPANSSFSFEETLLQEITFILESLFLFRTFVNKSDFSPTSQNRSLGSTGCLFPCQQRKKMGNHGNSLP